MSSKVGFVLVTREQSASAEEFQEFQAKNGKKKPSYATFLRFARRFELEESREVLTFVGQRFALVD